MSSPNAFDRLAPFVQEFVYRLGWQELRELQAQAIDAVFDSDNDILITTGTASGKTEAALAPLVERHLPLAGIHPSDADPEHHVDPSLLIERRWPQKQSLHRYAILLLMVLLHPRRMPI